MDRIAWEQLEHNYGSAEDVPGWLRDCASDDADRAAAGLDKYDTAVFHQGGWICSAASAGLPFLVDLAAGAAVHHRPACVRLIVDFLDEAARIDPAGIDEGWADAVSREVPRLLALLGDPDLFVRREATRLVGLPRPAFVAALRRRWTIEEDRVTRWDLISAFGALDESLLLHELVDDADPQTVLAAVHALAGAEPELPLTRVPRLLVAMDDPDIAFWADSAWFGTSIVERTGGLLQRDPGAALGFAQATGDLRQVAAALAQWRVAPPAEFLIERLGSDSSETRFRAAYLLACVPVPVPAAADALASHPVGDAATWALARLGDARCVAPLQERLAGPRLGFASSGQFFTERPGTWSHFWLPAVDEALGPLVEYAAALVPTVRVGASHALCRLLGAWGSASAPAVPQLVALLSDPDVGPTAATALGAIGPAAMSAAEALREHAGRPENAWAYWRITGDPTLALATLAPAEGHTHLRKLGDLGPLAAGAADLLREQIGSTDGWTRVEAAYALYRVTDDPTEAVPALTDVASPLADGSCTPVMVTALEHLAALDSPAARDSLAALGQPVAIAHAVLNNPRRLTYFGGWHTFETDERLRTAASAIVTRPDRSRN